MGIVASSYGERKRGADAERLEVKRERREHLYNVLVDGKCGEALGTIWGSTLPWPRGRLWLELIIRASTERPILAARTGCPKVTEELLDTCRERFWPAIPASSEVAKKLENDCPNVSAKGVLGAEIRLNFDQHWPV